MSCLKNSHLPLFPESKPRFVFIYKHSKLEELDSHTEVQNVKALDIKVLL